MEREFVSYEIALALKELGFDEPCFKVYDNMGFLQEESVMNTCEIECDCILERYLAPLYQQAFRWFREKHGIFSSIWCFETEQKFFIEFGFGIHKFEVINKEEAELECLKKLIEIVKNK